MQLHLVGGFLGSGKTTAIIEAAHQLIAGGKKVGVVTNDQGKYLVDTAFVQLSDIPAVEVSGGCFCCHYDDLTEQLLTLIHQHQPDVVFAESVGSCADIVATVIKPLLSLGDGTINPDSFSVFTDGRMLLRWVEGMQLPFSEDVVYIFEKQIEEAGILVFNKSDLVTLEEQKVIKAWVEKIYPEKSFRFQNSLNPESVAEWVSLLIEGKITLSVNSLDLDYARYARGEESMAWLNGKICLSGVGESGRDVLIELFNSLSERLGYLNIGIGHLKFVIEDGAKSVKVSFTSSPQQGWEQQIPQLSGLAINLLINARVETEAEKLALIFQSVLDQVQQKCNCVIEISKLEHFHPEKPEPTHQLR